MGAVVPRAVRTILRYRPRVTPRRAPTLTLALIVAGASIPLRARAADPALLRAGFAPLVFIVPATAQQRFRVRPTVEIHGALSYRADAAGGGLRVQFPLWPPRTKWHEIDSWSLSIGADLLARFTASSEPAWHIQLPVTLQYHVVLHRRLALFAEVGATPEILPGERRAFACWPTLALGAVVPIGAMGRSEYGVGPPYIAPLEARHPPTPPALVLRIGFPAGLQLGVVF